MQVLLTTDRAGMSWSQHEGDTVNVSDEEGARLIAAGQGLAVEQQPGEGEPLAAADPLTHHKQRNRRR